jgi:hypothetical protein
MVTRPVRIGLVVEELPPEVEGAELPLQPASSASVAMQQKYEVRERTVAVMGSLVDSDTFAPAKF